jgi:hypothetical protein
VKLGELHAALADADVYTARPRAEALLLGLGFKSEELERPVATFSGGWRMRLNLRIRTSFASVPRNTRGCGLFRVGERCFSR